MIIFCNWIQKLPKRYHGVRLASDVSYIVYFRQLKVSSAPDALWNMASIHTLNSTRKSVKLYSATCALFLTEFIHFYIVYGNLDILKYAFKKIKLWIQHTLLIWLLSYGVPYQLSVGVIIDSVWPGFWLSSNRGRSRTGSRKRSSFRWERTFSGLSSKLKSRPKTSTEGAITLP